MSFKINPLYRSDGYKPGHKAMLAPGTTRLYGTWIPRSIKYAPPGVKKILSFGHQFGWRWINDEFVENFFNVPWSEGLKFAEDMNGYLGLPYDGQHFRELHELGYLPIRVKAIPEGIETGPNIPHQTIINTVDGFAWLPLYLETIISSLAWKPATSATIALQYRRNTEKWVKKTDPNQSFLIPFMCHDFAGRGLDPHSMLSSGLGHATSFRGSDELIVIPGARYFYDEPENEVCINSVSASEHSVSCTNIFYYEAKLKNGELDTEIEWYYSFDLPCDGNVQNPDYLAIAECLMLKDWLVKFPTGILSYVCDTFNTWKSTTHIVPRLKNEIMSRDGKLVLRPDSGDPVDIICGYENEFISVDGDNKHLGSDSYWYKPIDTPEAKGVIELLWDCFGGQINEQGYKVLDSHIGCIYGDSINLERQIAIYERLAAKGFASTNIVLGVGSFTYQFNTRDSFGFAAKGAWFEILQDGERIGFNIFKDPITDDGTKKSLKGLQMVWNNNPNCNGNEILFDGNDDFQVKGECTWEEEDRGLLQVIFEDGKFFNQTTLTEIRKRIDLLL